MGASERRMAIWHTLCMRRQVTIAALSEKYNVSPRTIRYDIEALSRSYPIETRAGKNGGVKVADWFQPGEKILEPEQIDFLIQICQRLEGDEVVRMRGIIEALSDEIRA